MDSRLTPLQRDLLEAFFRRESRFFLTGGAALAGFHLGHRETHDLDLFTTSPALDAGDSALSDSVKELGATVENTQTAPTFRRRLVRRGDESVVVDLVLDESPQRTAEKSAIGSIRVDPPEEILVNKLCALLSRAELRDLVDLRALENAGHSLEEALAFAREKDGGLTPAQLAWVLSEIELGDAAVIPGGGSVNELRAYLDALEARLARLAFPAGDEPA